MSQDKENKEQKPADVSSGVSRRSLFHVLGAVPAAAALASSPLMAEVNPHHAHLPVPPSRPVLPRRGLISDRFSTNISGRLSAFSAI